MISIVIIVGLIGMLKTTQIKMLLKAAVTLGVISLLTACAKI